MACILCTRLLPKSGAIHRFALKPSHLQNPIACPNKQSAFMTMVPSGIAAIQLLLHAVSICTLPLGYSGVPLPGAKPRSKIGSSFLSGV